MDAAEPRTVSPMPGALFVRVITATARMISPMAMNRSTVAGHAHARSRALTPCSVAMPARWAYESQKAVPVRMIDRATALPIKVMRIRLSRFGTVTPVLGAVGAPLVTGRRSEERRVGKEWRSRGGWEQVRKRKY